MKEKIRKGIWVTTLICFLFNGSTARSQDHVLPENSNPDGREDPNPVGHWNWKIKTLGGMQFWSDVRYVGGWRVQRNSQSGHFRLIDPENVRHAWGNLAHCNQALDAKVGEGVVQPCAGKIVIVLHGLMRTKNSMEPLAEFLQNDGNYQAINVQYASSRETVDNHAHNLRQLIEGLGPKVDEINFVGHSLGNIVVRHYLGDVIRSGAGPDPRIKRMVMLGPPNQGSKMARILKRSFLFKTIAGASGGQLSLGWKHLEPKLATPEFEFGIIAGGQADDSDWSNFILKGKDDFTVSVQETMLPGARDFLVKPFFHSTMMKQAEVYDATLNFLEHGYFVSEAQRQPIPKTWKLHSPEQGISGSTD